MQIKRALAGFVALVLAGIVVAQEPKLPDLIPVVKEGKWGFCTSKMDVVHTPQYDFVWPYSEGLAAVKSNGKVGFIDTAGKVAITIKYDNAKAFENGLAVVMVGREWLLINKNGKEISKRYSYIFPESEETGKPGLYKVYNSGSGFGFINREGKEIVAPKWLLAKPFQEGLSPVATIDSLWGFVDTNGTMVIEPKYKRYHPFSEGIAQVVETEDAFLIDKNGQRIGAMDFTFVPRMPFQFHSGLAMARWEAKWGFINTKAEVAIENTYSDVHPFEDGRAVVKRKGRWGIIDEAGNEIVPITYKLIMPFEEGRAAAGREEGNDDAKYKAMGYLDRDGNDAIPFKFKFSPGLMRDGAFQFSEGKAMIKYDTGKGIIDRDGKELLSPQYSKILPFKDGLTCVKENARYAVMNAEMVFTTGFEYNGVDMSQPGPPRVMYHEGIGLVNIYGQEVVPPRYDAITWMGNNLLLVEMHDGSERFYIDVYGTRYVLD